MVGIVYIARFGLSKTHKCCGDSSTFILCNISIQIYIKSIKVTQSSRIILYSFLDNV